MTSAPTNRISSGVHGLDEVLQGGLFPARSYLVTGAPGTGKTIMGLHFLLADEPTLLISFNEPESHLREHASALGLATRNVEFLDLTADPDVFSQVQSYDIFLPSEVEREPIAAAMRERIEEVAPKRILIDGFSQLRSICHDVFHFHRMVQSLFRFVTNRGTTLMVTSLEGSPDPDLVLQGSADGVIRLARNGHLRWAEVIKIRGSGYLSSLHPMRITASGLQILPEAA
jgi:circadian clock protein KaiC